MDIYNILTEGFARWLVTMGYADSTVYASVLYVSDFFSWLGESTVKEPGEIDNRVIISYHRYLQRRKNRRMPGGLSNNYIISNINALKRLSRYLHESGRGTFEIDLQLRAAATGEKTILSQDEVKAMYRACGSGDGDLAGILGLRDRAILSIYYGCGLRRSEGISLNVRDVQLKEKLVYVRKGKNYRERYVPMSEAVKEDMVNYIRVSRQEITGFKGAGQGGYLPEGDALFLSVRGRRLCGNQMIARIQKLARDAGIQKDIGLHSLRHSIATHLLQAGMTLEEVSQFLGHSSLESTQIYTHLANE